MVQFKKWQLYLVILFSFFAILFSLPNFLSKETLKKFPTFIPSDQIVLGLDLQGGSYLLIEVDTESVISENFETFSNGLRLSLRKKRISYSKFNIKNNNLFFNIKDENKKEELSKILSKYSQDISFEYSDDRLVKIFFNNTKNRGAALKCGFLEL